MHRLEYAIFRLFTGLFARVPFGFLYVLSDGLFVMLYYVVRYRRQVVRINLRQSFPERSPRELRRISRIYYHHLCDIILETFKGFSLSEEELRRHYCISNAAILHAEYERGRSAILMTSHYGNWEWGGLAIKLFAPQEVIGVYKPLDNPLIDAYLRRLRGKWGLHLRTMSATSRALVEFRGRPALFCLIADQTPSNVRSAHWIPFLNQETAFLPGADKIAHRMGYPVYFLHTPRVRRGFYEGTLTLLCDDPAGLPEEEITRRYARRLEQHITDDPAPWLWSHRRWKRKRH